MSTNLLYWAYGIPILLGLRDPVWRTRSVWRLGRYSRPAAVIALVWISPISILFLWWPNNKYTVQGTLGFALLLIYYFGWARRRFAGPAPSPRPNSSTANNSSERHRRWRIRCYRGRIPR
jgi:hypothetical protein